MSNKNLKKRINQESRELKKMDKLKIKKIKDEGAKKIWDLFSSFSSFEDFSSISSLEFSKLEEMIKECKVKDRIPKCLLCKNHGINVAIIQHKRHCPYQYCKCEKCSFSHVKRKLSAIGIKRQRAIREDEERKEKKVLNPYEMEEPWPLEYGNHQMLVDYPVLLKNKYQKLKSLREDIKWRVQHSPIASVLEPLIDLLFDNLEQHLPSCDDKKLESVKSCINKALIIHHMKIVRLQVSFIYYLFPP